MELLSLIGGGVGGVEGEGGEVILCSIHFNICFIIIIIFYFFDCRNFTDSLLV